MHSMLSTSAFKSMMLSVGYGREKGKKGIAEHVNSVKELKRLKKEKIKTYKSVKGEHNVPTRDLSEYTDLIIHL